MELLNALYIINVGFIVIIFLIHLSFTRQNFPANRMMSVFLFCLANISLMLLLFSSKWILFVPHFYRTGNFFIYLLYPAAYLYVRKVLNQEGWKKTDILHLIPAFLYLADYAPFFSMTAAEKLSQLELDYAGNSVYTFENSWFLPHNFHFTFRSLLALIYVFFISRLWWMRSYDQQNRQFKMENTALMQWIGTLTFLLFVATIPSILIFLFGIPLDLTKTSNGFAYLTTTSYALFLLFKPEIIYGIKGLWVDSNVQEPVIGSNKMEGGQAQEAQARTPLEKTTYLSNEAVITLGNHLESFLNDSKAYLGNGYTITELSNSLGYSTHQISAYLNHHLGLNFNEYINKRRIEYLLEEVNRNDDWQKYTLEALGNNVGFNNRYSFLKAFKKNTGKTPSDYLNGLKGSK
jgi:AraC-like DNA-binding protein